MHALEDWNPPGTSTTTRWQVAFAKGRVTRLAPQTADAGKSPSDSRRAGLARSATSETGCDVCARPNATTG